MCLWKSGFHTGPWSHQNPLKTHFLEPGWPQADPHQEVVQGRSLKTKTHPWTLKLWSTLGCQPYICVQPTFGAKPPMTQKQLLSEVFFTYKFSYFAYLYKIRGLFIYGTVIRKMADPESQTLNPRPKP